MLDYKSRIIADYGFSQKGWFDPKMDVNKELEKFTSFVIKRNRQLQLYTELICSSKQGNYINSPRSIEMNKGALDSISPKTNVGVITPFADSFDTIDAIQKYDRVQKGSVYIINGAPVILHENSVNLVPVRSDISFLISQNPYDPNEFSVLRRAFESGNADIVAGIYADVNDKDLDFKLKALVDAFDGCDKVVPHQHKVGDTIVSYVIGFDQEANLQRARKK